MKIFGQDVRWSEPPQTQARALEQVTDIGISFDERVKALSSILDIDPAAVFRARQLTADTVASLPLRRVVGRTVAEETPELLTNPDPQETYHDTMSQLMLNLIDDGLTALWVKSFDHLGNPKSVYVVDPAEITVQWDRRRLYRVYLWRGEQMDVGRDFFPIAINRRRNELRGRGVLRAAADSTVATLRAQADMARELAEDNYTPTIVIKHPSVKDRASADKVREMFVGDRDRQGRRNMPAAMGSEGAIEQTTINPVDAQWIESRSFEVQEAARYFGLPGWFLLVDQGSSMTYSNTEGVMQFWATTTLRPTYLERIEQVFSQMMPTRESARFDMDEILRADTAARYTAYETGIRGRFLLPNEARAREGLDPLAGGDTFPELTNAAAAEETTAHV